METYQTVEVAERIMLSAQRDMWALADAVLHDVPARPERGGGISPVDGSNGRLVADQIARLAVELDHHGITKADGTPYATGYLRDMRQAAAEWKPKERQKEASFETHRASSGAARPVFLALCAVARGETVARPDGVEPAAWKAALAKLRTRRRGWLVQGEAVRIACGQQPKNAPTKLDGATFGELCQHLLVGTDGLAAFEQRFAEYDIEDADRERFAGILRKLIDRATRVLDVVTAQVTDEALAQLMETEQ